jgi:hypothetical protein
MMSNTAFPRVASLHALLLIAGTLLGNETTPQRVGFAFEGAVDLSRFNIVTNPLYGKIIPNGSRVTGTFSYDTESDGAPGFDGTRVFHQKIEGGFTLNFEGGPLSISVSDYAITVGNDYQKPPKVPAATDYLSVDYTGLSSNPVSPLIMDGVVVVNPNASFKTAMSWDASTWNDADDPKLRGALPIGQVLPFQSLAGPANKTFTITSLSPITPTEGDFNVDGKVDANDFVEWRKAFGLSTPDKMYADANHDGVVDAADYVLWRRALQGGGSLNPAVPEPSSVCLIALMFLYFFNDRR